jgi:hypothetical protein
MRMKPVRYYAPPAYPTRDYLVEHPELLRLVPERWRHNRIVLAVLSAAAFMLTSCKEMAEAEPGGTPSHVAPIFVHGAGRGSFGCVAMNPPVFLSEEEARQVIQEEAKKAGLDFASDALKVNDVDVPVTDRYGSDEDREKTDKTATEHKDKKRRTRTQDFVFDGYDKKHDVAYEFVSEGDFKQWERNDSGISTASDFDLKGASETLRSSLQEKRLRTTVAVFYEPGATPPWMKTPGAGPKNGDWKAFFEKEKAAARQIGREELRKQVRDFVQWLKAQGVI